ncbi:MAG: insulinase family protein [Bacteroidetes bacterium]|nr:insulinase family protein [Bacteroidota bacterium]
MKYTACYFILLEGITVTPSFSQEKKGSAQDPLFVTEYKLQNGLTVYLNEDHNQPAVFGMVAVRGGSKRDPKDATGMAHYLEHLLFKGTDKMGTVDYGKEKVILDSIRLMYDELGKHSAASERESIQIKINQLENRASVYAIPNELDRLISGIGGTFFNAFTSDELIVYLNMFPGSQIEKWMEIYSHRFIHPVFRLFQSELETVYEEKNRSMDNFGYLLMETFQKNFYKNSPYGQQPTIGLVEHLKNPSLSKMIAYYDNYYVANNMALILCGDFHTSEVIPMIEKKFGTWRTKEIPQYAETEEKPFSGREFISERLTPVRVGIMGFRTVPMGHPDEPALTVCNNILSNQSETGLFNKLVLDNKLIYAEAIPDNYTDMGGMMILFVPKILGQKMATAEKMITVEIEKVRNGVFDTVLVEAVKLNLEKENERGLEDIQWRGYRLLDAFLENKTWSEALAGKKSVANVRVQDVVRVANKYYGNDYLVLHSKMGFPKKQKLEKPPYKPVKPENSEAKSVFAKQIEQMEEKPFEPDFIEFGTGGVDVKYENPREKIPFYYSHNPINKIFTLTIKYGTGTYKNPVLDQATAYILLSGTDRYSVQEIKKEFQKLGSSYYAFATRDYFIIELEGFDAQLPASVKLLNHLLTGMKPDDSQISKLLEETKTMRKVEKKEPATLGEALKEYAIFGDNSSFLNRLSLKQIQNLSAVQLINEATDAMKFAPEIHYCGTLPMDTVTDCIKKNYFFQKEQKPGESPVDRTMEKIEENTLFFLNEPSAVQSQVFFMVSGEPTNDLQRTLAPAFNEYFGAGMFSIVFQEIREFRSLAYSSYAYYYNAFHAGNNGYLTGFIGTQADKTIEALTVFRQLVQEMPVRSDRLPVLKNALIRSMDPERGSFREISQRVADWRKQGYGEDPRIKRAAFYRTMEFKDIEDFYRKNLAGKKYFITVVGDKSRVDVEKLSAFGKVIVVDKKEIFR